MDEKEIQKYQIEEILVTAIKSEIEARDMYHQVSVMAKSAFLKERLRLISGEEEKHRDFLVRVFEKNFPEKDLIIPIKSPIQLPEVKLAEGMELSEIIQQAMEAEQAAHNFYFLAAAYQFKDDARTSKALKFLASMELEHYNILAAEKERLSEDENFYNEWPMMHAGP